MDHVNSVKRSEIMSKVKSSDTVPEIMLRKYLYSKGYRYRKNDKRFAGKPDVYIGRHSIAIFIHGCFWHGHNCKSFRMPKSNVDYWTKKIEGNVRRDEINNQRNIALGIKVITIWECDLKSENGLKNVFDKIVSLQEVNDQ